MSVSQPDTAKFPESDTRVFVTPEARYAGDCDPGLNEILSEPDFRAAYRAACSLPGYAVTPLVAIAELADRARVAGVTVKLEGERQPLGSYKLLGPPIALAFQLARRIAAHPAPPQALVHEVIQGQRAGEVAEVTAVAATSGNHGRALAWAARQFGCRCRIYMPQSTGRVREQVIRSFQAEVVRTAGVYDRAVEAAAEFARHEDALLIGDGSPRGAEVKRHILHGYSVLAEEWLQATRNEVASIGPAQLPTHLFVPAGSGTLAAAVTARLWLSCGAARPKVIVVQPHSCDSALRSATLDRRVATTGDLATVMDGLSVASISSDAWAVFRRGVFGYVTISDAWAIDTLRLFSRRQYPPVGETGIAALAGLLAVANNDDLRQQLKLDSSSHVGVIATEGITDPEIYRQVLGLA